MLEKFPYQNNEVDVKGSVKGSIPAVNEESKKELTLDYKRRGTVEV